MLVSHEYGVEKGDGKGGCRRTWSFGRCQEVDLRYERLEQRGGARERIEVEVVLVPFFFRPKSPHNLISLHLHSVCSVDGRRTDAKPPRTH